MLTKRNYFVILMLFIVVFIMFMLVDVTAGILTRRAYNPQADVKINVTASDAFTMEDLCLDLPAGETGTDMARHTAVTPAAPADGASWVVIVADDRAALSRSVMLEWCLYNRCRYRVVTDIPAAEEVQGCSVMLVAEGMATPENLPALQACARAGVDMIFAGLPEYAVLEGNPELADFFGISRCVQPELSLKGVYLFDEVFIGGERIYGVADDFGDGDEDARFTVPWYELRPGYQLLAQCMLEDEAFNYMDLPAVLWRTRTENADVFVSSTSLFGGKNLLGMITAMMSQKEPYFIYPVVNAQTISLLDFPMLSQENSDQLQSIYSRDSVALGRDVLWPAVAKILRNYDGSYNFFMAPQLDYQDANAPSEEFVSFYRQEIERLSGAMGLSLHQMSDAPVDQIVSSNEAFLASALPEYRFTAVYADREDLSALLANRSGLLDKVTLVMTEMEEDQPLLGFADETTIQAAFTTDGFVHETLEDLRLLCIETALGMNNQKVEMVQAFYPVENEDWNALNLKWSRGDTYIRPFKAFDSLSVYEMEERVRRFLALDFTTGMEDNVITLNVEDGEGSSFILRLHNHRIVKVEGAQHEQLSETAWLLRPQAETVAIHTEDMNVVRNAPTTIQEVIRP